MSFYPPVIPTDICQCGHMKIDHVYLDGNCRPGFVCEGDCKKFRPAYKKTWLGNYKPTNPEAEL